MSRLSKQVKQDITDAVADDIHNKRNEELLKLEHTLANQILDRAIGASNMRKMKALPLDYFQTDTNISVKFTVKKDETDTVPLKRFSISDWKRQARYRFNSGYIDDALNLGKSRPVPQWLHYGQITLDKDSPLLAALKKYGKDREKFSEEVLAAIAKVETLLASVTTDKKLFEIWPEAKKYMPKPEPVAKLPTVRGEDVNDLISCTKKVAGCK